MKRRILILGGTTEARQLAERLAGREDLDVTVSLAGRVSAIVPHPVPVRVGGFGGVEGLAAHLEHEGVDLLVDATHPFASEISRNAAEATAQAGIARIVLRRPPWQPLPEDRWHVVADLAEAVTALGLAPRRVFLALGRQHVSAFGIAPQHVYLVRSIEPVADRVLAEATYIAARGPFDETDERALLSEHRIDTVVARNSGGDAGYAKVVAARAMGLPIVMITPPAAPEGTVAESVEAALALIDHPPGSATLRGV